MLPEEYRYNEYKYIVSPHAVSRLKNRLDSIAKGTDPYPEGIVESNYYDTMSLLTLNQCKDGSARKIKFRTRRYNEDKFGSLQIKAKNIFGVRKLKCHLPNWQQNISWLNACDQAAGDDLKLMLPITNSHGPLSPVVQIKYRRHRYRIMGARITLDEQIVAKPLFGLRFTRKSCVVLRQNVLEIKTEQTQLALPPFAKGLVRYGSFSKFALSCRELLGETF